MGFTDIHYKGFQKTKVIEILQVSTINARYEVGRTMATGSNVETYRDIY